MTKYFMTHPCFGFVRPGGTSWNGTMLEAGIFEKNEVDKLRRRHPELEPVPVKDKLPNLYSWRDSMLQGAERIDELIQKIEGT